MFDSLLFLSALYITCWKEKSNLHYTRDITTNGNEWRGPSARVRAWATQLQRNAAVVANRWRHRRLDRPGNRTSRTDSDVF